MIRGRKNRHATDLRRASVEARQVRPVRPAAVSDHPRPCGAFFESGAHSALLKLAGVAPLVYACGARSRRLSAISRKSGASAIDIDRLQAVEYDDGCRYRILFNEVLGSGAQGTVYRGLTENGEPVAIKVIPTWRLVLEPGCEVQKLAEIEAELETLRALGNHPNIAGLIATATINRVDQNGKVRPHYKLVVMEVVNGRELAEHVAIEGPMRESVARSIFLQILDGLAHMHKRGVIHRDLKPENMMVTGDVVDLESRVKLIDFGVAKCLHHGPLETVVGTPSIMAPEIAKAKLGSTDVVHGAFSWGHQGEASLVQTSSGPEEFSPKVDVWSTGVCLYTCLTGKLPFRTELDIIRSEYDRAALHHLSEEAKDLLANMLEKDASKRLSVEECLAHPWVPCSEEDGCTIDWDNLPEDEFEYDPLGSFP